MVTFAQTEMKIDQSDIDRIEKITGLKLPDEYKRHLLMYNGGQCEPNIFSFIEHGNKTESCIDWFLAIYKGEYDNLEEYIRIYKVDEKRLPEHMLPIAHDPGGNLICISCDSKDEGFVYFWNHELEVDYNKSDDFDYSNLYLIADSFQKFMNNLT